MESFINGLFCKKRMTFIFDRGGTPTDYETIIGYLQDYGATRIVNKPMVTGGVFRCEFNGQVVRIEHNGERVFMDSAPAPGQPDVSRDVISGLAALFKEKPGIPSMPV